ncbi:hypothetical protein [Actinospica robiniae]|uniref:hypothetical protein n=1 Tax=Actinospica robiniae TaxID=304901 RepID=UPI00041502CF|nr:hypothetical protein [Actinospica robiniae]
MASRSTIRSGTTKSLIYSVLGIVFGAALILIAKATWANPADCGGQTMQQGDTCEVTDHGETSNRSLSDQESSNHREAVIMFVVGPLMIAGSGFWLASEIRIRQRRGATATGPAAVAGAGPFPPGNTPYPPQFNAAQQPYPPQQPYGAVPPQARPAQPQYQQPQYQQPQQPYPPQQYPQQPYPPQQYAPQYGQPAQPQPPQQPYQQPPQQGGWPAA